MIVDKFTHDDKKIVVLSSDATKEIFNVEKKKAFCVIFFLGCKMNLPKKQLIKKQLDIKNEDMVFFFVCFENQRYHRDMMIDFLQEEA